MLSIDKYKICGTYTEVHADVVQWLSVDWQEREGCFVAWALVDVDSEKNRCFLIRLVETGELIGDTELEGYGFLGSVNLNMYVSHFFVGEVNPKTKDLIKDDSYEPFVVDYINKNFDFTWNPDYLNLDPESLGVNKYEEKNRI